MIDYYYSIIVMV